MCCLRFAVLLLLVFQECFGDMETKEKSLKEMFKEKVIKCSGEKSFVDSCLSNLQAEFQIRLMLEDESRKVNEEERKAKEEERKVKEEERKVKEEERKEMMHNWSVADRENQISLAIIDVDTKDFRSVMIGFFAVSFGIFASVFQCCPASARSPKLIIFAVFSTLSAINVCLSCGLWSESAWMTSLLTWLLAQSVTAIQCAFLSLHFETENRSLGQVWSNADSVAVGPDARGVQTLAAMALVLAGNAATSQPTAQSGGPGLQGRGGGGAGQAAVAQSIGSGSSGGGGRGSGQAITGQSAGGGGPALHTRGGSKSR
jgi:hypothetical protein